MFYVRTSVIYGMSPVFLPLWPPWLISPPAGQAYNLLKALSQTLRWLRTFIIPQKKNNRNDSAWTELDNRID